MQQSVAIQIEHLTKQYRTGLTRRGDIRRSLTFWWEHLGRPVTWYEALSDINLTIAKGDVMGLIGPNGAGKSTLLRILSRITWPTKGRVILHGRVSSLLEVGVGFHPELSGRDNIFLNGVIQGMKRHEIVRKFNEIVAFSGLADHIDQPVKQYSSGMYVRLAFSVAAFLESDILLLDEIVGVGDIEFRERSLQKLRETISDGRTVVMVSHQLDMIRDLCHRAVYLDQGRVLHTGTPTETIQQYLEHHTSSTRPTLSSRTDRQGSGKARIQSVQLYDAQDRILPVIQSGQSVSIRMQIESAYNSLQNVEMKLDVTDVFGRQWLFLANHLSDGTITSCPGNAILECHIPKFPLAPGFYHLHGALHVERQRSDMLSHIASFEVTAGDFYPTGKTAPAEKGVLIPYQWKVW